MAIPTTTLAATGTVLLREAGHECIASWMVQLTGTWTGEVTFTGFIPATALTASDAVAIGYKPSKTGTMTDGATAITANGLYVVVSDAASVILNWTRTTGSLVVNAVPLRG